MAEVGQRQYPKSVVLRHRRPRCRSNQEKMSRRLSLYLIADEHSHRWFAWFKRGCRLFPDILEEAMDGQ